MLFLCGVHPSTSSGFILSIFEDGSSALTGQALHFFVCKETRHEITLRSEKASQWGAGRKGDKALTSLSKVLPAVIITSHGGFKLPDGLNGVGKFIVV